MLVFMKLHWSINCRSCTSRKCQIYVIDLLLIPGRGSTKWENLESETVCIPPSGQGKTFPSLLSLNEGKLCTHFPPFRNIKREPKGSIYSGRIGQNLQTEITKDIHTISQPRGM